jgi:hypothetical protein
MTPSGPVPQIDVAENPNESMGAAVKPSSDGNASACPRCTAKQETSPFSFTPQKLEPPERIRRNRAANSGSCVGATSVPSDQHTVGPSGWVAQAISPTIEMSEATIAPPSGSNTGPLDPKQWMLGRVHRDEQFTLGAVPKSHCSCGASTTKSPQIGTRPDTKWHSASQTSQAGPP